MPATWKAGPKTANSDELGRLEGTNAMEEEKTAVDKASVDKAMSKAGKPSLVSGLLLQAKQIGKDPDDKAPTSKADSKAAILAQMPKVAGDMPAGAVPKFSVPGEPAPKKAAASYSIFSAPGEAISAPPPKVAKATPAPAGPKSKAPASSSAIATTLLELKRAQELATKATGAPPPGTRVVPKVAAPVGPPPKPQESKVYSMGNVKSSWGNAKKASVTKGANTARMTNALQELEAKPSDELVQLQRTLMAQTKETDKALKESQAAQDAQIPKQLKDLERLQRIQKQQMEKEKKIKDDQMIKNCFGKREAPGDDVKQPGFGIEAEKGFNAFGQSFGATAPMTKFGATVPVKGGRFSQSQGMGTAKRLKTAMCPLFEMGGCTKGVMCVYAHNENDLASQAEIDAQIQLEAQVAAETMAGKGDGSWGSLDRRQGGFVQKGGKGGKGKSGDMAGGKGKGAGGEMVADPEACWRQLEEAYRAQGTTPEQWHAFQQQVEEGCAQQGIVRGQWAAAFLVENGLG